MTPSPDVAPRSGGCAGATRAATVALILAAGAGSRFRGTRHKLLSQLPGPGATDGPTVVETAVARALDAAIGPVVVVTGSVEIPLAPGVIGVHNERWADGQITSLQRGLAEAERLGATRAVVGLGDQPGIDPAAWRAVAAADGPIAVATYAARRGNPVALDRTIWGLLPTTGDEGARALMRSRPDLVREVPCTGSAADIDTLEDLRRWQSN